jgi:hypothetical protein
MGASQSSDCKRRDEAGEMSNKIKAVYLREIYLTDELITLVSSKDMFFSSGHWIKIEPI